MNCEEASYCHSSTCAVVHSSVAEFIRRLLELSKFVIPVLFAFLPDETLQVKKMWFQFCLHAENYWLFIFNFQLSKSHILVHKNKWFLYLTIYSFILSLYATVTTAINKGIHVISSATWHCYWPRWTAVSFAEENFNSVLDKEVQIF